MNRSVKLLSAVGVLVALALMAQPAVAGPHTSAVTRSAGTVPGINACVGGGRVTYKFVTFGYVSPATEERSAFVVLKNVGSTTCALRGYPRVWFTSPSGRELHFQVRHASAAVFMNPLRNIKVAPGHEFMFKVGRQGCAGNTNPRTDGSMLHFIIPGSSRVVSVKRAMAYCIDKGDFANILYVDALDNWVAPKL